MWDASHLKPCFMLQKSLLKLKKLMHMAFRLENLQLILINFVNGKMELLDLNLQDDILEEDKDMIEDLIISAVNNAMTKAQEESQNRMNAVTGGMMGSMKIPGM